MRYTKENQSELDNALVEAVEKNNSKKIIDALNAGASPLARNNQGESVWDLASEYSRMPKLLRKRAFEALKPNIDLVIRSKIGEVDKIKDLLENNKFSESVLTAALISSTRTYEIARDDVKRKAYIEISDLLLKKGANPNLSLGDQTAYLGNQTANEIVNCKVNYESMKSVFDNREHKMAGENLTEVAKLLILRKDAPIPAQAFKIVADNHYERKENSHKVSFLSNLNKLSKKLTEEQKGVKRKSKSSEEQKNKRKKRKI